MEIKNRIDIELSLYKLKQEAKLTGISQVNLDNLLLASRELLVNILKHGGSGDFNFSIDSHCIKLYVTSNVPYNQYIERYKAGNSHKGTLGYGIQIVKNVASSIEVIEDKKSHTLVATIELKRKKFSSKYSYFYKIQPFPGEEKSGDMVIIEDFCDALIFLHFDILGHGEKANLVVKSIEEQFKKIKEKEIEKIGRNINYLLKSGRGAVGILGKFFGDYIEFISFGNIKTYIIEPQSWKMNPIFSSPGIWGSLDEKKLQKSIHHFFKDSLFLSLSDGVRLSFNNYALDWLGRSNPKRIVEKILEKSCTKYDDASVLVIKRDL